MITTTVLERLGERGIEIAEQLSLKPYSSFRIGGTLELGIFPNDEAQMLEVLRILREESVAFTLLGNGSNVLFGDGLLEGAIVFTKKMNALRVCDTQIEASCGTTLAALACAAAEHSLSGLEFARGIPGSVGGAIFMNAGAYGGTVADVLLTSRAWDPESGDCIEITEHDFDYRTSIYMHNRSLICLGGRFALRYGEKAQIEETMRDLACRRKEKQPLEFPSAGSYFKRPEGHFAGKLIEDCGLKGYSVGGAQISEKHAGFVINRGGATAEDVLRLEEYVKNEVFRRYGVTLEREVRVIDTLRA